jgi:hypothetical protein
MHPWDIGKPVSIYEARFASIFFFCTALKLEAGRSSELLVPKYQATRRHIPEGSERRKHRCENL